jgi:hypothetical protein
VTALGMELHPFGVVQGVRDHHHTLRSLVRNLLDGSGELRRGTHDDAQRTEILGGARSLGTRPEHGEGRMGFVQQDGNAPGGRRLCSAEMSPGLRGA